MSTKGYAPGVPRSDDRMSDGPKAAPEPPDHPVLRHHAWRKMWIKNNNTLWTVIGDTGDGKSWASIKIGEVIDPNFSAENIAYSIEEFIELVADDSFGRGSVIVLEEGSVEASSYDWHQESNRIFSKILDTWRHQNRMGIINLPNFQALEKGARRRTKMLIEMMGAHPRLGYSIAKPKIARYGNIEDNFRTPFPTINGREYRRIRFEPPSEEVRDTYEEQKEEYTTDLNRTALMTLSGDGDDDGDDELTAKEVVADILEQNTPEQYVKEYNGRESINRDLIELDYGVGGRKGKKVKAALERELL